MSIYETKVKELEKNFSDLKRWTLIINMDSNWRSHRPLELFTTCSETIHEYMILLQSARSLCEFLGFFDMEEIIDDRIEYMNQDIIDCDPNKAGF